MVDVVVRTLCHCLSGRVHVQSLPRRPPPPPFEYSVLDSSSSSCFGPDESYQRNREQNKLDPSREKREPSVPSVRLACTFLAPKLRLLLPTTVVVCSISSVLRILCALQKEHISSLLFIIPRLMHPHAHTNTHTHPLALAVGFSLYY